MCFGVNMSSGCLSSRILARPKRCYTPIRSAHPNPATRCASSLNSSALLPDWLENGKRSSLMEADRAWMRSSLRFSVRKSKSRGGERQNLQVAGEDTSLPGGRKCFCSSASSRPPPVGLHKQDKRRFIHHTGYKPPHPLPSSPAPSPSHPAGCRQSVSQAADLGVTSTGINHGSDPGEGREEPLGLHWRKPPALNCALTSSTLHLL